MNASTFFSKTFYIIAFFSLLFGFEGRGQQQVFSRDGVSTGNWGDGALPWYYQVDNNSQGDPDNGGSTANLVRIGHNNNTSMDLNGRVYRVKELLFESGASSSRTFSGNILDLRYQSGGPAKIENMSVANHTFNNSIALHDGTCELNPINGDLTFTANIFNNGNFIDVFGDNGHSLNISGVVQGTGGIALKQNSTLNLTGQNTYTGGTYVEGGTLRLNRSGGGTLPSSNNVTTSGGTLRVSSDQTLNNLTITSGGLTVDAGAVLTIDGDFSYTAGTLDIQGGIVFAGAGTQNFPSATVNDLTVNRSSGNASLAGDLTVNGTLTITNGNLSTSGNKVILGTSASITESGGRVEGLLEASRNLTAATPNDFGGIGFTINPDGNMGQTTVTRQTASSYTSNSETAMALNYQVNPTTNGAASIVFKYDDSFLGGRNEDSLKIFKSADGSPNSWFQLVDGFSLNKGSKEIAVNVPSFSILTSHDKADFAEEVLPVSLTSFNAVRNQNTVQLSWQTASELNNDFFEIQRSTDLLHFEVLGTVAGNGTSSSTHNYSFVDDSPLNAITYYRLRQVDFDGRYEFSRSISVKREEVDLKDWILVKNQSNLWLVDFKEPVSQLNYGLTDANGKLVLRETSKNTDLIIVQKPTQAGLYLLDIQSNLGNTTLKLIVE